MPGLCKWQKSQRGRFRVDLNLANDLAWLRTNISSGFSIFLTLQTSRGSIAFNGLLLTSSIHSSGSPRRAVILLWDRSMTAGFQYSGLLLNPGTRRSNVVLFQICCSLKRLCPGIVIAFKASYDREPIQKFGKFRQNLTNHKWSSKKSVIENRIAGTLHVFELAGKTTICCLHCPQCFTVAKGSEEVRNIHV